MNFQMIAYADGSCINDGYPRAGIGVCTSSGVRISKEITNIIGKCTNNRAELYAALEATSLYMGVPLEIRSDSIYVVKGITTWVYKWMCSGWVTSKGEPVENQDLWARLINAISGKQITFKYVKGHADDELNNVADYLARNSYI